MRLRCIFSVGAALIAASWLFNRDFELFENAICNAVSALGIFVALPILGIICIRYYRDLSRIMGWVYLVFWLLAVIGIWMQIDRIG